MRFQGEPGQTGGPELQIGGPEIKVAEDESDVKFSPLRLPSRGTGQILHPKGIRICPKAVYKAVYKAVIDQKRFTKRLLAKSG